LAGRGWRFFPGVFFHLPGGDSVHFHALPRASPARLQRRRHRDVVFDGLRSGTHDRASPMASGYCDGYSWVDSRGHDHNAGRMKQMRFPALIVIAVILAGGNALAGATTNAPDSQATSTPPALSKEVDERAWSFSASVSTY